MLAPQSALGGGREQGSRCPELSQRVRLTGLTRGIERGHNLEVQR